MFENISLYLITSYVCVSKNFALKYDEFPRITVTRVVLLW